MIEPHELTALMDTLAGDLKSGLELYSTTRSPFALRTYIRSFFAYVEAWAYLTRQLVVSEPALHLVSPSPSELALLSEESYDLNGAGEVVTRRSRFTPLDRNIRFVFAITAKCFGGGYKLDASSRGWQSFREAIRIRNRLTHPKRSAELTLSDTEVQAIKDAQLWFLEATNALQASAWAALNGTKESGA